MSFSSCLFILKQALLKVDLNFHYHVRACIKKVVIFFFTFQNLTFIISQDWNTEMKLTEKNMSLIGSVHCKKGEFSLLSVSISCICVFGA